MTTELYYLFLCSLLLGLLWVPFVIGQVVYKGLPTQDEYRNLRDWSAMPRWVHRANRAHLNFVEQFGAFAGLIVVAHLAQISTPALQTAAAGFFWARAAHAVIFVAGFPYLLARTVMFIIANLCLLVIAWQIFSNIG
ncbi:MAG: MAPEG family protein [Pseudomonadota bacterium]